MPGATGSAAVPGASPGGPRLFRPFTPLRHRDFRLLWLGQNCQAGSQWAERVARSLLIYELTGSAVQLGAVELMRGLGTLLLGTSGGVLADRMNKRTLLMVIQTWNFAVFTIVATLALTDALRLWHLYVSTLALSLGQAVNQPVRTSFIPSLVPQNEVLRALTLNSVAVNTSRMVTPVAVGAIAAVTGEAGYGYVVGAGFYALMLIFTAQLRVPPTEAAPEARESFFVSLKEGVRYVLRERVILAQLIVALGPLAFAFSYQAILVVYAVETLGLGATGFGLLFFFVGFGALAGGFSLGIRGQGRGQGYVLLAAGLLDGLALLGLGAVGLAPGTWPLYAMAATCLFFVGATQVSFMATNNSLLLMNTPRVLRGRVMGLVTLRVAFASGAALMAGAIADAVSPAAAMAALGVGCVTIVLVVAARQPRLRVL